MGGQEKMICFFWGGGVNGRYGCWKHGLEEADMMGREGGREGGRGGGSPRACRARLSV